MSNTENKGEIILGWDVGGTKCAVVTGTFDGKILARKEWKTQDTPSFDKMLGEFVSVAAELLQGQESLAGLGVSVGGPMNMKTGEVFSPPHLPGWGSINLKDILGKICFEKFSEYINKSDNDFEVVVQHDAAACLQAEYLWGAARGTTHSVYLTCSTGCGSGVMVDGRILCGPDGESPEIGYMLLSDSENLPEMQFSGIARRGQVELFCSGTGLSILAHHRYPEIFSSTVSPKEIAEKARDGNSSARLLLEESARRVAQLCTNISCMFAPQVIIPGSLARYFDAWWLYMVRESFRKDALPANSINTEIRVSELGDHLQDFSTLAPIVIRSLQK
jgi:glucokinase